MGHDLIGCEPIADRLIGEAEAFLGYDIRGVCLEGSGRKHVPPREEAQVIYVLECAYAAVLQERQIRPRVVCGHSLGNWAAAYACGVFDFLTGLQLVTHVESLLEELVDGQGQTMGVVIGLDESALLELLEPLAGSAIANWNSPGQYVIAGPIVEIDQVLAEAARLGAKRARRLSTDRALHTPMMADVGARLRLHLETISCEAPCVPFLSCSDSRLLRTAGDVREFLAGFLVSPVRWEGVIRTLAGDRREMFVEVGPGNVLSGMLPFIDRTAVIRTASEILSEN
jgi:malonyl CoA-acyl carrier protein transacylase